ncbi:MAG: hypothetical protein IPK66_12375 [Rhodospirillales bacterium]|nr:hypothetical protein [Rhodospirillales bacterium]
MDHVFIERLWLSLKYEVSTLKGYADNREARAGIPVWILSYCNCKRPPHQALAGRAPITMRREGVIGVRGGNAVDITLRLDDSAAPSACPQQAKNGLHHRGHLHAVRLKPHRLDPVQPMPGLNTFA